MLGSIKAATDINKANLKDLIAATSLVILLKLYPNRLFFSPCDLEIWWMTPTNNRAPLLYYIKLCASFQINQLIQTRVTVRKCSTWVKIDAFFEPCDGWPWKTIGHLFLFYFELCVSFRSHWLNQTGVTVRKRPIWVQIDDFQPRYLEIGRMTFKSNRAPRLCYFKLCALFCSHFGEFKLEQQSGNT